MRERKREPATLKALYGVPELARITGIGQDTMRRLLRKRGIELVRVGRTIYVPLSELGKRVPQMWQSIMDAERMRHAASVGQVVDPLE